MIRPCERILVPVDIAGHCAGCLEAARQLAADNPATIDLLHVIQTIESGDDGPDEETIAFYERLRRRIEPEMQKMARPLCDTGAHVRQTIRTGDRLQEIVSFAREHDTELIIMRARKLDPRRLAATWGTLSYKVSLLCDCPILLLK